MKGGKLASIASEIATSRTGKRTPPVNVQLLMALMSTMLQETLNWITTVLLALRLRVA